MAAAMAEWKGVCWVPRVVARRDDTMVAQLVYLMALDMVHEMVELLGISRAIQWGALMAVHLAVWLVETLAEKMAACSVPMKVGMMESQMV